MFFKGRSSNFERESPSMIYQLYGYKATVRERDIAIYPLLHIMWKQIFDFDRIQ